MHVWQLMPPLSTSPETDRPLWLTKTKIIAGLLEEKQRLNKSMELWNIISQAKMQGWESKHYAFFSISVQHTAYTAILRQEFLCSIAEVSYVENHQLIKYRCQCGKKIKPDIHFWEKTCNNYPVVWSYLQTKKIRAISSLQKYILRWC